MKKSLASDNYSGVHPKILENMIKVNEGHKEAYGEDTYTIKAKELILKKLGASSIYFMSNGTGTNITLLDSLTHNYGGVICSDVAHIYTHESGAASKIGNITLLPIPASDGKIRVEDIKKFMYFKDSYHFPKPEVISITQPTELGTLYTLNEIKSIVEYAHANGLKVHMDGARISNAAVALNCSLKDLCKGIDALSFGMCKNGMMYGEAGVFFNNSEPADFDYTLKQNLQLQSKMRYIAIQYLTILEDNLWEKNARKANNMATLLTNNLKELGIEICNASNTNILYVKFPLEITEELQNFMYFYIEDKSSNTARLVTSFDTELKDIESFIEKIKTLTAS